jgi:hypothetical protein
MRRPRPKAMKDPFIKPTLMKDPFVMPTLMKDPFINAGMPWRRRRLGR